jgi:hypothetical protein
VSLRNRLGVVEGWLSSVMLARVSAVASRALSGGSQASCWPSSTRRGSSGVGADAEDAACSAGGARERLFLDRGEFFADTNSFCAECGVLGRQD